MSGGVYIYDTLDKKSLKAKNSRNDFSFIVWGASYMKKFWFLIT